MTKKVKKKASKKTAGTDPAPEVLAGIGDGLAKVLTGVDPGEAGGDKSILWKGPDKFRPLLVPLDVLEPDPENEKPHTEEQITRLTMAMQNFGQREVINIFRMPRPSPNEPVRYHIKGGEARLRAATVLGWTHLAAIDFEGTPEEAAALRISLNQLGAMTKLDELKVASTIRDIREGLGGLDQVAAMTGYSLPEMEEMTEKLNQAAISASEAAEKLGEATPGGADAPTGNIGPKGNPVIKYELIFDNEEQQKQWYEFMKGLKGSYPNIDTIAGRVIQFIRDESLGLARAPAKAEVVLGAHGREAYTLGFETPVDFAFFLDFNRRLKDTYGGGGVEADGGRVVQFARAATGGSDGQDQEENSKETETPTEDEVAPPTGAGEPEAGA